MRVNGRSTWFWALMAVLFFVPFLGGVHLFDWDEINFAEIAREMLVSDNYLETYMNYGLFTEKPPFFFWLQALSMYIFGVNEFAARLPNALMGAIALPVLYHFGKTLHNRRFGYLWALAYFGSILPHLYFLSGIIDPVFNFFIFLGIYFLIKHIRVYSYGRYFENERSKLLIYVLVAGISTGIAVLTKGPVAYLVTVLTLGAYWFSVRFKWFISIKYFVFYTLSMIGTLSIWAGLNWLQNGNKFLVEFTIRQWELLTTADAGHGGFWGYHVVVLLFGCFPASIFAIQAMVKKDTRANNQQAEFKRFMIFLFWVVLVLFSLVSTKIVHYSSLAYYPLTYLAAISLARLWRGDWRFSFLMKVGVVSIGLIAAILTLALPFLGKNIDLLKPLFAADPFAQANLQADVAWHIWQAIPGIIMLALLLGTFVFYRKKIQLGINVLFFGTAIWVTATLFSDINNIEAISQRASIDFWKKHRGEDCYVYTFGYKSYAHFFYAETKPHITGKQNDGNWLLTGFVDKPVYISCKITAKQQLMMQAPDAELLYEKNGFCFFRRTP